MNKYWHLSTLKSVLHLDFFYFDLMSDFCPRIPSRTPCSIHLSRLLRLLLAMIVYRLALFLMTLTVLRSTGQVFCKISFSWDLCNVFLISQVGLWVFRSKTTEGEGDFHHILSRVLAVNTTRHCRCWPWSLAEVAFVRFLGSEVTLSLLPILHLWARRQ